MPDLLLSPPPEPPLDIGLADYAPEHRHTKEAIIGTVGLHILGVLFVALLTWLFGIKSLHDLMASAAIKMDPPQAEIEVELQEEKEPPPPPTDHPEFIIIKPVVPPTPPPPKPKPPVPKPPPPRPHTPAPPAKIQTTTHNDVVSKFQVGDAGLLHPPYPGAAQRAHITGTVTMRVSFSASGQVDQCEVIISSGSALLDFATKDFALSNWNVPHLAGTTQTIPVIYTF